MAPKKKSFVKKIIIDSCIVLGILFFLGGSFFFILFSTVNLPDFNSFDSRIIANTTKIYDRTGQHLLFSAHQNISRTVVPLNQISDYVKKGVIAIEDDQFYTHNGIRPTALLRAILVDITGAGMAQGGSTITQQLIKKTLLTDDKTIIRKAKEIVLALKMEQRFSKDKILELYLNEIPYGGNIYGIEEASQTFFSKHATDINLAEAAYLAAIPNAPSYYSPYGKNKEKLNIRKNLVLDKMRTLGFITEDEYNRAKNEVVTFFPLSKGNTDALHFSLMVRSMIEEKYGSDAIESGGLKIITTLDYDIQKKTEEIVKKYSLEIEQKFKASNAATVIIDPKTGQVLSLVGSRDYFDKTIDGNFNVALAGRQPGSTFKPIVYATAFKKGYTDKTVLFDLPTEFNANCNPDGTPMKGVNKDDCYMPYNADGNFRGPMTLRDALAQSINVVAVKLLYLVGINNALQTARAMGIKSLSDSNQYGLTLVLGGGEVSLLELTNAYGVFANKGTYNPPVFILSVADSSGNILEQYTPKPETNILPEDSVNTISSILSDNNARIPIYGTSNPFVFPGKTNVAAKTGTTNDYRDVWVVGYSPDVVVGSWAGNNDNTPMIKKTAGFIISPMWHDIMAAALQKVDTNTQFTPPLPTDETSKPIFRGIWWGGETYMFDVSTNATATPQSNPQNVIEKVIPNVHSILYWVDKNNPTGPKPENPQKDSQFNLWETPIQKWLTTHQGSIPQ